VPAAAYRSRPLQTLIELIAISLAATACAIALTEA
jgi:hypothetical protein